MDRAEKEKVVANINKEVSAAHTVIVAHYIGLNVDELTDLRNKLREIDATVRVTKNRLAKLAIKDTQYEVITDLLKGPTAIACSEDPVAAAKGMVNFANDNDKLVIIGGASNGEVLDIKKIEELAKLPSLDELRAKILGMINTPATRIAGVVQAPGGQIARVIKAYSEA